MPARFRYNILLFVIVFSFATLCKGDKCSLKDGSKGNCKLLKECPTTVQQIKTKVDPVICGINGTELIVCCKDEDVMEMVSTTTITNPVSSRIPGDISKQKCKEYSEYAYEKIQSPTLLLNPYVTKKLECDFQRNRLVVGSTLAARREFPHMVPIGYQPSDEILWVGGGSLISEHFVLTSAVCLFTKHEGYAKLVRISFTNKTDPTHMQERTISERIPHPKHNNKKYHDIGLLRLSKDVKFNTYVRPACLHTEYYIPHILAIASGWGAFNITEGPSNDLLATVLEFYSVNECNNTYRRNIGGGGTLENGIVDDLMICAGISKSLRSTCQTLIGYQEYDNVVWLCGGSLISENFVLTAAHCLISPLLGPAKLVRVGSTNKIDFEHMQERTVSEVIRHVKFNNTLYNDIGLLKLSKNVKLNTYVRPACLHTERYIPYDLAVASGWGKSEANNNLLEIVLELFSAKKCNHTYSRFNLFTNRLKDGIIDDLMICAGTSQGGKDTCEGGGVGGPLQVYHEETEDVKCMYDIIGVITFGEYCGLRKDSPGVFTRVSTYIKWIEDTVWPD